MSKVSQTQHSCQLRQPYLRHDHRHCYGVKIGSHVIIGAGSIVLPGVTLEEGVAVGALSLVKKDCEAFGIYMGVPAKRIGGRKRDLLELEQQLRAQHPSANV
jgi:galactoside O-acetyltransferase